jgi:hypothetical protein
MIHTDDHPPAHVHVFHGGNEAIVEFDGSITIRENKGFNNREMAIAKLLVRDNLESLLNEWRRIHG